jgi:hypothetical protein
LSYPYNTPTAAGEVASTETPVGCRDFKLRYAKDGKGHDFNPSYTYPSSTETLPLVATAAVPKGCRDFKTLRYAKDGKGHNFSASYPYDKN